MLHNFSKFHIQSFNLNPLTLHAGICMTVSANYKRRWTCWNPTSWSTRYRWKRLLLKCKCKSDFGAYESRWNSFDFTKFTFFCIHATSTRGCLYSKRSSNAARRALFSCFFSLPHRQLSRGGKTPAHMGNQTAVPSLESSQPSKVNTQTVRLSLNSL